MKSAHPVKRLRSFRSRSTSRTGPVDVRNGRFNLLIGPFLEGPKQATRADTPAALPRKLLIAANCTLCPRFGDVLRSHERDSHIRLHYVSRSSNAFVWCLGRRELVLSQGIGLLAWRGHDGNMALPGMVVDKSVFD